MDFNEEREEATNQVINILEEWGSQSKFIWFRDLHRITDIDKGLLRNIINELKKSREIKEMHGTNNRIFFCLRRYYIKCRDVEFRFKGKEIMLRDGSKTKIIHRISKFSSKISRHFFTVSGKSSFIIIRKIFTINCVITV